MLYIPKLNKEKLKPKQLKISNSSDFLELFKILNLGEKIVIQNKNEILYQYYYTFKFGHDKQPLFTINVKETGEVLESYCYICRKFSTCHHVQHAIKSISEDLSVNINDPEWIKLREESIKDKINQEKIRIKEEKERLVRLERLKVVQGLLDVMSEQDVSPLTKQVTLYPIIYFSKSFDDIDIFLSLKVGIDKMYVVSNVESFVDSVINNEEKSYGKFLSFKHNLNNFDTPSRDLLEVLIKQRKLSNRSTNFYKGLKIDLNIVEYIINAFKDRYIEIEGLNDNIFGTFYVGLNKVEIGFKLDENYVLSYKNLSDDAYVLDCPSKSYYIIDRTINLISYPNSKMRPLYKFVKENQGFSFSLIKDVLEKEIIARYYDYLEFDEAIKPELEIKDFKIEAYIDYDHESVKLNSKYYYDNQEVSITSLKDNSYINLKIDKYNLIIKSLGFIKGEIKEASKIFQFLKFDLTSLKENATVYLSDRLAKLQTKTYKPSKANVSYDTGLLNVCLVESEYSNEELASIIKSLRKKVKYIKLKNNVILEVSEEDSERLLNTIDEFNLNINHLLDNQSIPAYHALKLNDEDLDILDYNKNNELVELLREIGNYKNANFNLPIHLRDVMRSYQIEAFLWMKTLIKYNFSGILADDMGLGKTLEMISVIISDCSLAPSLIVCPKSLSYNWKNEFELWAEGQRVVNIIGSSSERENIIKNINNNEAVTYITSYDSLRNDIELYKDKNFLYTVLDEGQYIKNHETLKAQSVKNINSKYRFVLTGTPIENTVMDLWSIFDFLMPGYLNNITKFRSEYERAIIMDKDSSIIGKLVQKISPFILRRVKEDVIKDLPEKTYIIQAAKMTDAQKLVYDAELLRTRESLESSDNKIELLAHLTRLRQICVDPSMFLDNYNGGSGKIDLALELIEDYISLNHRIVLFSQFTSIFNLLESEVRIRNIKYFILTGKTDAASRVEMATEFNNNEDYKVFLVSLKAGGTGLNLTGADVVIHLDPWWNIAAENQATDRSHRIGQTKTVQVVKLVSEDSIEQKVIELQEKKKEIAKLIVADDDANIQKLTNDDLKFILN